MRLDLVIPAHNEEDRIDRTLRAYRSMVSDPDVRFLVALDDCTDGTAEVVLGHMRDDSRVALRSYPKLGKGGVVMESFRRSDADLVGFVDADGSTPPGELMRLVDTVDAGADLAIASRRHPSAVVPRKRPVWRRLTSSMFPRLVRLAFRLEFDDTQCGAKVARREVLESVLPLLSSRDFLFDVDLLVTATHLGWKVAEVPTVWIDQHGSRLGGPSVARRMAASLLRLWLHHRVIPLPERRDRVIDLRGAEGQEGGVDGGGRSADRMLPADASERR
jgi:glycosyltransferase involved in cell wall biosynthesis